jgi:transposase
MKLGFKYRLYPTRSQEQQLLLWMEECRRLWNACISETNNEFRVGLTLFTKKENYRRVNAFIGPNGSGLYQRLVS